MKIFVVCLLAICLVATSGYTISDVDDMSLDDATPEANDMPFDDAKLDADDMPLDVSDSQMDVGDVNDEGYGSLGGGDVDIVMSCRCRSFCHLHEFVSGLCCYRHYHHMHRRCLRRCCRYYK